MAKCQLCGKATAFGGTVSHRSVYVTGRNKRKVYPNLQTARLPVGGVMTKMTVCTRCLRTARKTNLQRQ